MKVEGPLAVSLHADGTGATVKLQVCGNRLQTRFLLEKGIMDISQTLDPGHNFFYLVENLCREFRRSYHLPGAKGFIIWWKFWIWELRSSNR